MELSSARELLLVAYTAPAGSASHDALKLLASWTAEHRDRSAEGTPAKTEN